MITRLKVGGMMCAGGVSRVKKALIAAGATDVKVELPDFCEFDCKEDNIAKYIDAIEDLGFSVNEK